MTIATRAQFREFVKLLARRMPHRSETEAVVYLMERVERYQRTVTNLAEHAHIDQALAAMRNELGSAMERDLRRPA